MALEGLLDAALGELTLELDAGTRHQLLDLASLVDRWARRINLTAHRGAEGALRGLVLEALALERVLPPCASLLDLGSGAGFPGLPIAIVRGAACSVTLLDSRRRRHHFQRAAIRELGLENVEPLLGRSEELEARGHEVVLSQALAEPSRAIGLMQGWVEPGGWLGLAVSDAPTLDGALLSGLEEVALHRYRVPLTGRQRILWIAKLRV